MKSKWNIFLTIVASMYMLLAYQNCGQKSSFHPDLVQTNPDTPAVGFISKIAEDADLLYSSVDSDIDNNSCKLEIPDCAREENPGVQCIEKAVLAYYKGLECSGFKVFEADDCIAAVSTDEPKAMDPILVDMTCFNNDNSESKSLNLGVCYGEDIGFNSSGPSTGMRISAWMDLGNQYPYSRQLKQIVLYPNQSEIELRAFDLNIGKSVTDACGKSRTAKEKGLIIPIRLQSE